MKHLIIILFTVLISVTACNSQEPIHKQMNFKIEITNFYFGRTEYVTILTEDSIRSETGYIHGKPKIDSWTLGHRAGGRGGGARRRDPRRAGRPACRRWRSDLQPRADPR
jgi:hypothetical protein